jgi:hypothetical protein
MSLPIEVHTDGRHEYNEVLPGAQRRSSTTMVSFHPSATQPSIRCLTSWLRWTIALFTIFPDVNALRDKDARVGFLRG